MTDPMPVPDAPHEQMDDAAFWVIEGDYSRTRPVDRRAVYGHPRLGDRDPEGIEATVRKGPRDLRTAIRALGTRHTLKSHPDDRARANDGGWMEVLQPTRETGPPLFVDEGFAARYENGSVIYNVRAFDGRDVPPGTYDLPWMRRADNGGSRGEVRCLEVEWGDP